MIEKLLLGYDVGSSFVKAALIDAEKGALIASVRSPETELPIVAERPGWAEQDPEDWWDHIRRATALLGGKPGVDLSRVAAIGISYQMHGLVMVDHNQRPLAPSIIWCDSRSVEIGNRAFEALGRERCMRRILNSPGNFTASKLRWVKDNRPDLFAKVSKIMLPGDYIAMKLTGEVQTTPSGLSEGMLWDFVDQGLSEMIMDYYEIPRGMIPTIIPTFGVQGRITKAVAVELGIPRGTLVSYRAGDQPNNAMSVNVLNPGELAATAGTSGVVYGIADRAVYDMQSRVNTFIHVNDQPVATRNGVLLCVNGTGILNSWMRQICTTCEADSLSYAEMNSQAAQAPVGAGGITILPYGNGAERTLGNISPGASVHGLSFTTHSRAHLLRAVQEGIVFALNHGMESMKSMGIRIETVRAAHANMFLSPLFAEAFANVTGAYLELFNTDGAQGAARGAGIGAGIYGNIREAFSSLASAQRVEPSRSLTDAYGEAYARWKQILDKQVS